MWRMERTGGLASHFVIAPGRAGVLAAWFLNGRQQGMRAFTDVGRAIRFSEQMQHQNWAVGWRLVSDEPHP